MMNKGKIEKAEFDYIHSDSAETPETQPDTGNTKKISWFKMLTYRQTWSFVAGKFLTDGVWFFLLFWLPTYVKQQFCFGLTPEQTAHRVMISTFIAYGVAIVGSVYGGAISMLFINKGWESYKARMTSMLIIAIAPLLLLGTQFFAAYGIVAALAVISIGCAAHQAWSANLYTTVSDMFPKKTVGTITGIGTAFGGLGGVVIQQLAGHLEDYYRPSGQIPFAYGIMFCVCALAYLSAWIIMKLLVPKFKPITNL